MYPPGDRGRARKFLAEQTPASVAVTVTGAVSLVSLIGGTLAVLTAYGWTPSETLERAIISPAQGLVLAVAIVFGAVAIVGGLLTFKRLPTKGAREGAMAGVVSGAQGLVLGTIFLAFRAGDVESFARNFFEFEIVAEFWERFVRGAVNTVILAFSGEALGIILGLLLAVLAVSRRAVVRAPARTYINFFRGTPLLWQLNFIFFGIVLGLQLRLTTYQVAILVLGLNAGAYSAEIFRAGIQSLERGQFEAARSLGMSHYKTLRFVILPQAIRRVIPPLTNEFVILIKDTSLVSILGLTFAQKELLAVGRDIYSATFNATPFLGSAAGYLVVTIPMIRFVSWLERRLRSGITGIPGIG